MHLVCPNVWQWLAMPISCHKYLLVKCATSQFTLVHPCTHITGYALPFGHSNVPPARMSARGEVIEFVCLSVENNFEMAWISHFQPLLGLLSISEGLNNPILLTCTCHWADSLPLSGISAVFLLSGPLCQPFYLQPPVTPISYMPRVHLHSCSRPAVNFA